MTHAQQRPNEDNESYEQQQNASGQSSPDPHRTYRNDASPMMNPYESLQRPAPAPQDTAASKDVMGNSLSSESSEYGTYSSRNLEPAWCAARALMQIKSDILLKIMLRTSFRPMQDTEFVPIYPCPHCGDGGLRTAGTIRMRKGGRAFVRACDTCCAVEVGEQQVVG